jgi:hypothetical protein
MSSQRKNGKKTRRSQGRGQRLLDEQLLVATDVGRSLSDGSTVPLSDMQQRRMSMAVPNTIPKRINEQVVWARATLDLNGNLSAVAETQIGIYFTLAQLPGYTNWTSIFDQYCIPLAVLQIRGGENVGTNTGGPPPRMYSALDHDDANLISVATIREYASCKEQRIFESVTRVVYPRIATAAYSGAFTSFANERHWIDAASPSVQHYGAKVSIEADTRATVGEYLIRYTVYYAFRNHH